MPSVESYLTGTLDFPASSLSAVELETHRSSLTFRSLGGGKYGFGESQFVCLLEVDDGGIVHVPRRYAYAVMPTWVTENVTVRMSEGSQVKFVFNEEMQRTRPELKLRQDQVISDFITNLNALQAPMRGGILCAPCGCHAAGELILMADGTRKPAEDVLIGDLLMGIDGPRRVLSLHRGRQRMARVVPNKGDPFTVNAGHILTLLWSVSDGARKDGDVIDMSVAEWVLASRNVQRHTVLYRPRVDEFFNDYTEQDRPIGAYYLGMLLGDGNFRNLGVTTEDEEVLTEINKLAVDFGLRVRKDDSGGRCPTYHLVVHSKNRERNMLLDAVRALGLGKCRSGDKFVPDAYLTSSRRDRMELLAGLLDTDGSLSCGGFDWISKSRRLADGVVFLCRSLGLAAYMRPCEKFCQTGKGGTYYRVSISGDCSVIPMRIARKRAAARRINKDVQRVGFKVELMPEADYYGFVVDGDHRYLLGDFTWTHNTGKTVVAAKLMSIFERTTLVLVHKEFLMDQWTERLKAFLGLSSEDIGYVQQDRCQYEGKKVVLAMVQSLMERDRYPEGFYAWPGLVISDECHRMAAPQFQLAIPQFPAKYRVGLTATPRRSDGLQPIFEWHIGKVIAKMQGGTEVTPKIYQVPFKCWVPDNYYIWKDAKTGKVKKLFLGKLVSLLVDIDARNTWIAKEIVKATKADRKVMLLSDRREHLEVLKRLILGMTQEYSVGFYVGGMSKEEREDAEKCNILLGTFQMAKEGLDIPEIDTLYLVTPKSDVEQSIGRILRYHEDKKDPVVVDIVDTLPICVEFAAKRARQYSRLGWDLHKPEPKSAKVS